MSLIYVLLMGALDLAGVFFNIRMLRSCLKDKTKYTILQKCRALAICQCVCQVTILVTDSVGSWKGFDIQPEKSCNVFRVASISMMFYQACNLVAILITHYGNRQEASKLKISAVLSLGFVGSATVWWYSCFSQEFISQIAFISIFVVTVAFVVLLFVVATVKSIYDEVEDTTPAASMKTCPLLWSVCKENKTHVFFITLLLICFAVISSGLPRSELPLSQDFEHETEGKEFLYSFITRFVVGIILPVTFSNLIDSSFEEGNEMKALVV